MICFHMKDIMKKRNMTRYRFMFLSNWDVKKTNKYYFGKVKYIKPEDLDLICDILDCNVCDILDYKKTKRK